MELLAPAGSAEKLRYAYRYGADAAYIGLPLFSLRAQAENIDDADSLAPEKIGAIKKAFSAGGPAGLPIHGGRKLYCAANIYFHDDDLSALEKALPRIAEYPFDAFIVSDLGTYDILRRRFPEADFHLSTQANATNWRAAKLYRDMGFSRIVPGRELSLDEIKTIKDHVPELEVEAFVHGAMCMSYSGRCFISSWLAGRSANKGDCTHSCRWHYKIYLEEEKRPGQMIPVESGDTSHGGYNLLMSSRDLCMIDHIDQLAEAGVDSIKIEGRMKSLYYVALVARAYRYALDNPGKENPFREDLFAISHREYDTGFFFGREGMDLSATKSYKQAGLFAGSVEAMPTLSDSQGSPVDIEALFTRFQTPGWSTPVYIDMKNTISAAEAMEAIAPDAKAIRLQPGEFRFFDGEGNSSEKIRHRKAWFLQVREEKLEDFVPGEQWLLRVDGQGQG
ncbi:MAG TPA: peptidase U32 family protein [Rectinemataceae bacterium]|nr:peptidase U32 family protein [Rectinemataceae bacterium]